MRKQILRRLEALEKEHRSRELSLNTARVYWKIVIAYHLGGLKSDELPNEAYARALKYRSMDDYLDALIKQDTSEFVQEFNDAFRRLFAKVGLDFDGTPPNVLFDAFDAMVNELPDQWLNWLRSKLRQYRSNAEIAAGSYRPRRLSGDNFLYSERGKSLGERISRVNTRIRRSSFSRPHMARRSP